MKTAAHDTYALARTPEEYERLRAQARVWEDATLRLLDRERRPRFGGRVVVGLRPEAFEDAAFAPGGLPQVDVRVEVVEELGSDTYVFFELDVEPIVVEEAVSESKDEEATTLTAGDRGLFTARVNARTKAQVGEMLRLAVDPSLMYFFSPDGGESLLDGHAALASAG